MTSARYDPDRVTITIKCETCDGTGDVKYPGTLGPDDCPGCDGTGRRDLTVGRTDAKPKRGTRIDRKG